MIEFANEYNLLGLERVCLCEVHIYIYIGDFKRSTKYLDLRKIKIIDVEQQWFFSISCRAYVTAFKILKQYRDLLQGLAKMWKESLLICLSR